MEKKNLDWGNIGYCAMLQLITAIYQIIKNRKWDEGTLTEDPNVVINECAGILQYCQRSALELKGIYAAEDGGVVTFPPRLKRRTV